VLLRQAFVYCIGSERDELIVDTLTQAMMVAQAPLAAKSWRRTAHVQNHIDALATSGRQWQGAVGDWSREESIEFLRPELQLRKHFYKARRSRMVLGTHELPESLLGTAKGVCSGGVVQRAHATRAHALAAKKGIVLSGTANNQKLKKWQDSEEGLAWKACRDKMFQADGPESDVSSE
jgi:hypothetical protein